MRLASYLGTSRHGVYYFRWPLPPALHPSHCRSDIRVSLCTRSPAVARHAARVLAIYGQAQVVVAIHRGMRYDAIRRHVRDHFREMLRKLKERVSEAGPLVPQQIVGLTNAQGLAELDTEDWAMLTHPEGAPGLMRDFCARRSIPEGDLTPESRGWLLKELRNGHRSYAAEVLAYNAGLSAIDLRDNLPAVVRMEPDAPAAATPFQHVLEEYFREIDRPGALAAKTLLDKRTALDLLGEITGNKPLPDLTKADARNVKDMLTRLPKNRNKSPKTRDKPLTDILDMPGVDRISVKTTNEYLGQLQSFMSGAVNNGHAADNVFEGMRIKGVKTARNAGRSPFSAEQLELMFRHLTENPTGLVSKQTHKWGTLIGMFTGMRLNEVAQLETYDIQCVDGVWCIDVTEDGDDQKRLKSAAAHRRIPVHDKLITLGLLDFVEIRRTTRPERLFPDLSYTPANGYGRNLGRWVNEKFLPALNIKQPDLVYHSFRHTMTTRLFQAGADEAKLKAIIGHEQAGVTYQSYFKEGFLPAQLKSIVDLYNF